MISVSSSRRRPAIKVQYSAQCTVSFDAVSGPRQPFVGIDHDISDSLVRSLAVVEVAVDLAGMPQAAITDEPEVVQALGLHRPEEPFDVGVAVGCSRRRADDGDASIAQHVEIPCMGIK